MGVVTSDRPFGWQNDRLPTCEKCEWLKQFDIEGVKSMSQEELNACRQKCANCRNEFKFDSNIKRYRRALNRGKKWKIPKKKLQRMCEMRMQGFSYRAIGKEVDLDYKTVYRTMTLGYPTKETNERIYKALLDVGYMPDTLEQTEIELP